MSCNSPSDINQTFIIEPLSITGGSPTISACTAIYTTTIFPCSGNTSIFLGDTIIEFSGDSSFNGSVSADTFYSGGTNLLTLIQDAYFTGNTSGNCINEFYVSNLYGCSPITLHDDIIPVTDDTINLGSGIQRFRQINTVSGMSTVWTSTTSVTTAMLDLGVDSDGNLRQITANNSIIQNDVLDGDIY